MKKNIGLLVGALLISASLFAQADLQVLATVKLYKSESITVRQLKARAEVYKKQTGVTNFTLDHKKEILESLIDEKLLLQAAQKDGITVSDSEVNAAFLQSMSEQIGKPLTEPELAQIVKQQTNLSLDDFLKSQTSMNTAEYKQHIKTQIIAQRYLIAKRPEILQISATDAEIRSAYEMNKTNFVQPDVVQLFLVVVAKQNNPDATAEKVGALLNDFKSGKLTQSALREKAKLDPTKMNAGEMYLGKTTSAAQQLGWDFQKLLELFAKPKGFYSEVNETAGDYQFYQVVEKYDQKTLALSDVVQPGSNYTVYELLKDQLSQQKKSQSLITATTELISSLKTPENYQMLKTGEALDTLLTW